MTLFESISVVLGISAMLMSIFAIGKSRAANTAADKANALARDAMNQNLQLSQQTNFFAFLSTVNNLPGINTESLIGPDVREMATALDVISTAWEKQTVDRKTIYRTVGDLYKRNYEKFNRNTSVVPGYSNEVTLDSLIKDFHEKTYNEMNTFVP